MPIGIEGASLKAETERRGAARSGLIASGTHQAESTPQAAAPAAVAAGGRAHSAPGSTPLHESVPSTAAHAAARQHSSW